MTCSAWQTTLQPLPRRRPRRRRPAARTACGGRGDGGWLDCCARLPMQGVSRRQGRRAGPATGPEARARTCRGRAGALLRRTAEALVRGPGGALALGAGAAGREEAVGAVGCWGLFLRAPARPRRPLRPINAPGCELGPARAPLSSLSARHKLISAAEPLSGSGRPSQQSMRCAGVVGTIGGARRTLGGLGQRTAGFGVAERRAWPPGKPQMTPQ